MTTAAIRDPETGYKVTFTRARGVSRRIEYNGNAWQREPSALFCLRRCCFCHPTTEAQQSNYIIESIKLLRYRLIKHRVASWQQIGVAALGARRWSMFCSQNFIIAVSISRCCTKSRSIWCSEGKGSLLRKSPSIGRIRLASRADAAESHFLTKKLCFLKSLSKTNKVVLIGNVLWMC